MKFEGLAIEYANLFGASSPQWYSLPKRVAEAAAAEERPKAARPRTGDVGWVSAEVLDLEAVARLRSATLQLPLPWVLDWSSLQRVEAEAAGQLTELFKQWAKQRVEMRWQAGDQLLSALQEAAPTGVRDADPVFWMCRLEALRLANRPDQFDEAAIDYCVTYEVSPPSWERTECIVRLSGGGHTTGTPATSVVSEVSTGFMESSLMDDPQGGGQQVATVDLSGQLIGDIGSTLTRLDSKLAQAPLVNVSCARLIRVDFIAAGDLLNWVLSKRSQNRSVTFVEAHRLVALFFGAMGINEHARVQVLRD
jgi:ABC-type transporter Mla MlaB component